MTDAPHVSVELCLVTDAHLEGMLTAFQFREQRRTPSGNLVLLALGISLAQEHQRPLMIGGRQMHRPKDGGDVLLQNRLVDRTTDSATGQPSLMRRAFEVRCLLAGLDA